MIPALQVLVLSTTYQPLYMVGVQKAITLLYLGKAVSVQDSEREIRSPSIVMRVPQAIRLLAKVVARRALDSLKPTRSAIFKRDKQQCQYCSGKTNLTIDHVVPRSRGGLDTWDNLVTACVRCNNRKGDRTPQEAQMTLLVAPPRTPRAIELAYELWGRLLGW
ncbi:MAG: HNH endonuclease [Cyanobacteria bacterium NC_groundwater_1444_Ag_S-0.65um_54_12]|nr:HNH endonuclease [Cyanobacteria bacterium NC_groundwater_1444_Ag_S-0.65um_54_12]